MGESVFLDDGERVNGGSHGHDDPEAMVVADDGWAHVICGDELNEAINAQEIAEERSIEGAVCG